MQSRTVRNAESIGTHPVVVEYERQPSIRTVINLPAHSWPLVESSVGLPSVDVPIFDLQFIRRKYLHAQAVEKPRSVGGNIGRLVCPVVKIVVAEEADVRHEDSSVDVDSMH